MVPRELADRSAALRSLRDSAPADEWADIQRELAEITMAAEFADADIAARALPEILDDLGRSNWQVNRELGDDYDRYVTAKGFVASLRRLQTPALLLHGDHDFRPMWAVEELARLLPAAKLVKVRDAGHLPWLERPTEVRAALRDYLASLAPVSATAREA
jgi:pimeloyl-ACP methyl ester carboxylesterase